MENVIAHRRLAAHRFLVPFQDDLTHRSDGTSWSRWRETWHSGVAYVAGLLTPGRAKSTQRLADRVGVPEDRLERFVRESPWEYEPLQGHLLRSMPATIRSSKAALVVDDVGLRKQGKKSVGVARQYSGALGKVGNCQVAVDVVYAVPGAERNADQLTWPVGMRLYLPREWAEDSARRDEVGVPEDVAFQTKNEIALDMLARAYEAGLPHRCTLADALR